MTKINVSQKRQMKCMIDGFLKILDEGELCQPLIQAICWIADYDFEAMEMLGRPYGLRVQRNRKGDVALVVPLDLTATFSAKQLRALEASKKLPNKAA